MKKRKTYEVSVINKTYSKTYSDETKFYTSDTALELNFQLKEVEYDFDSAEIILLNVDDRSLVTRPVVKSAEGFTYELEDDIVEHYGEWKGQLKFNEGGEIYVSSPVVFRIENDLSNDRPPQLTEVNNWKNLRNIADGLISDMRSEIEVLEAQELEIQAAETARQTAESTRVENENQREIDHANRSSELDGKADKVVIKNLIENGDFLNGTTEWITTGGYNNRFEVVNGVARNTETNLGNTSNNRSFMTNTLSIPVGHMVYSNIRLKINDLTNVSNFRILYGVAASDGSIPISVQGTDFSNYSGLLDWRTGNLVRIIASFSTTENIPEMYLDYAMLLDLTEIFGTGNEPTKEEMDELIKVTGYIDGEYALNNKEMLGHLMKGIREKANKQQEDWITPTLSNGAMGTAQYRKNQMGRVEFRGRLKIGNQNYSFRLPLGYRPNDSVLAALPEFPGGTATRRVGITKEGLFYVYGSSENEASLDALSYPVQGV